MTASTSPTLAISSAGTRISFSVPEAGASISIVSFGVVMVSSISPFSTLSPGLFDQ